MPLTRESDPSSYQRKFVGSFAFFAKLNKWAYIEGMDQINGLLYLYGGDNKYFDDPEYIKFPCGFYKNNKKTKDNLANLICFTRNLTKTFHIGVSNYTHRTINFTQSGEVNIMSKLPVDLNQLTPCKPREKVGNWIILSPFFAFHPDTGLFFADKHLATFNSSKQLVSFTELPESIKNLVVHQGGKWA